MKRQTKRILSLVIIVMLVFTQLGIISASAIDSALAMPKNVLYSPITENSVTITWDASEGATGYNIYRRDAKVSTLEKIGTISSVGYVDTTVVQGTDYYYSVTAFNDQGESAGSKDAYIMLANNNTVELNRFYVFTTGSRLRLGDLDGDGRTDILVCNTSKQSNYTLNGSVMYALVAYNIEGQVLWSFSLDPAFDMTGSGVTSTSSDEPVNIADVNGDGYNEVVAVCHPLKNRASIYTGGVFLILDGRTGKILKDASGNDCSKALSTFVVPGLTQTGSGSGSVNSLGDCVLFANLDGRQVNGKNIRQYVLIKGRYDNLTAFQMFDLNGNFTMNCLWRDATRQTGQTSATTMIGHTALAVDLDGDGIDEIVKSYAVLRADGTAWWWMKTNVEMRSGQPGDPLNDTTPAVRPGTTTQYKTSDHVDTIQVGDVMGDGKLCVIFGGAGVAGASSSSYCYTADGKFLWCSEAAKEPQSLNLAQFRTDSPGLLLYGLDRRVRSNYPNGADGMFVIGAQGETLYKEQDNTNHSWSSIVVRVDNWNGTWAPLCASFNRNTEAIAYVNLGTASTTPTYDQRLATLQQNKIIPALYDGYFNKLFEMADPSLLVQYRFMSMDICGDARTELLGYTDAGDVAIFYNDAYGEGSTPEGKLALMRSGITGVPKQQSTFMSNYSRYPTDVYYTSLAGRTPAQPRALNVGKKSAYIDWTPVIGATSYALYRNGEKIGDFTNVGYQETKLALGEYKYTVVATDGTANSPESNPLTLTISKTDPKMKK